MLCCLYFWTINEIYGLFPLSTVLNSLLFYFLIRKQKKFAPPPANSDIQKFIITKSMASNLFIEHWNRSDVRVSAKSDRSKKDEHNFLIVQSQFLFWVPQKREREKKERKKLLFWGCLCMRSSLWRICCPGINNKTDNESKKSINVKIAVYRARATECVQFFCFVLSIIIIMP